MQVHLVEEAEVGDGAGGAGEARLHSEAEHGHHRQPRVLDLGLLEPESLLRVFVGREVERVEVAAWVEPLLAVELAVAVHLDDAHEHCLNVAQLRDGERQRKAQVAALLQLHLARVHPAHAGAQLRNDDTQRGQHAPAAVDQLALAESSQVEYLYCRERRQSAPPQYQQQCH